MSLRSEEIFTISTDSDYVTFLERVQGDTGRDIAAVKLAMGYSAPARSTPDNIPSDLSLGQEWILCSTNNAITEKDLVTFEPAFKNYLMSFQLTNQFVMICYFFEKYCVEKIKDDETYKLSIESAIGFFDSEFGKIGEGTLALLHGWRPNSVWYNHSYTTTGKEVFDAIPKVISDLVSSGAIIRPRQEIVREIDSPSSAASFMDIIRRPIITNPNYADTPSVGEARIAKFLEISHAKKHFFKRVDQPAIIVEYSPESTNESLRDSILSLSTRDVVSMGLKKSFQELNFQDRYQAVSSMLEPNPTIDPPAFEIGARKFGHFMRTEYTLESLPNFNLSEEQKSVLKDIALHQVILEQDRPIIWNFTQEAKYSPISPEDYTYVSNQMKMEIVEKIDLNIPVRIVTRAAVEQHSLQSRDYDYFYDEVFTGFGEYEYISFIEFRTPSLRPGDVYRGYFEISKQFLQSINAGKLLEDFLSPSITVSDINTIAKSNFQQSLNTMGCGSGATDQEDLDKTFEHYKSFAMRNKREISRRIRSTALQVATTPRTGTRPGADNDINVDLGILGDIPFLNVLDDIDLDPAEAISDALGGLASMLDTVIPPALNDSNSLKIGTVQLKDGVSRLGRLFSSEKVISELKTFKPTSPGARPINGLQESNFVSQVPALLEVLAKKNNTLKSQVDNLEGVADVQALLDEKIVHLVGGSRGTYYEMSFESQPLRLSRVSVSNKKHGIDTEIYPGKSGSVSGALTRPRTLNYIKNIFNMIPIGFQGSWGDIQHLIGLGAASCSDDTDSNDVTPGASVVLKYTIQNNGSDSAFTFEKDLNTLNPWHNWAQNYSQRERVKNAMNNWERIKEHEWKKDVKWGADDVLPEIGPTCNLDDLFEDILGKKNLGKLLCNYLTCIKMGEFDIKVPNLNLPDLPDLPVFLWPGWSQLGKGFAEAFQLVVTRIICVFVRNIIDIIVSSSFCDEPFARSLFGSSGGVPGLARATASALLDIGIPPGKSEQASNLVEASVNFLTPRELCSLLNGDTVGDEVANLVINLAKNYGLEVEIDSKEKVLELFLGIGIFIPSEFCEALNADKILGSETCTESTSYIVEIRNAISKDQASPEQIEEALALAEKNLMDKTRAAALLTGELSISDMFEDVQESSVEEEMAANPALQEMARRTANATLQTVKSTFIYSVNSYVSSLYLDKTSLVNIDSANYDPEKTMKFLRAINNLQKIKDFDLQGRDFNSTLLVEYLRDTILKLADDYEKTTYNDYEVYKTQLDYKETGGIPGIEANPSDTSGYSAFLDGSLIYGTNLSQDLISSGTVGLYNEVVDSTLNPLSERIFRDRYPTVYEYLFPIDIETVDIKEELTENNQAILDDETRRTESITSWTAFTEVERYGARNYTIEGELEYNTDPRNISLNISYLNKMKDIVLKLQQDVQETSDYVFRPERAPELFYIIKDFYDINKEKRRQDLEGMFGFEQLITTRLAPAGQELTLSHPVELLDSKTSLRETTISNTHIKSETIIRDSFFYGSEDSPVDTIIVCDPVPEKYRRPGVIASGQHHRRGIFKKQIQDIVLRLYNEYSTDSSPDIEESDLNSGEFAFDDADTQLYIETLEGVTEQLVDILSESRMFNDESYIRRIDSKIRSRSFIEQKDNSYCRYNQYNDFKGGIIRFDELITDLFSEQYQRELISDGASGQAYNEDFSTPGPFERAMMTTALMGYIRMMGVEVLMKGAIAYSSWDIDFLSTDQLYKEYLNRLVLNAINNQPAFRKHQILVDNALMKLTGLTNRTAAVKKIIDSELSTTFSDLSKRMFENDDNFNFKNWYLSRIPLVDAPSTLTNINPTDSLWLSNIPPEYHNKMSKNNYTFMERYIRTSGVLPDIFSDITPSELARKQFEALKEFIRYDSTTYPQTFSDKLYEENDPEFLNVPLNLNIPSKSKVDQYEVGSEDSIIDRSGALFDDDQWPNKELWSVEEFDRLIKFIYSNNTGVEKFIYHMAKKFYQPGHLAHGAPNAIIMNFPLKPVRRRRKYYRFSEANRFSILDPKAHIQNLAQSKTTVNPSSYTYYENTHGTWFTGQDAENELPIIPEIPKDTNGVTYLNNSNLKDAIPRQESSIPASIEYNDRFYIIPTKAGTLEERTTSGPNSIFGIRFAQEDVEDEDDAFNSERMTSRGLSYKFIGNEENKMSPFASGRNSITDENLNLRLNSSYDGEERLVYKNVTEQVSEEEYNNFVSKHGDNLEELIWEESIIDLVGKAAPIFDQLSSILPNSTSDYVLEGRLGYPREADQYREKYSVESRQRLYQAYLKGYYYIHGETSPVSQERIASGYGYGVDDNATGENFFFVDDAAQEAWIHPMYLGRRKPTDDRGVVSPEGIDLNDVSMGWTFVDNYIRTRINRQALDSDGNQNGALSYEQEYDIIGENEYKIPLRIFITQLVSSTGEIYQSFVKYRIPKALENPVFNPSLAEEFIEAAIDAVNGFIDFYERTFEKAYRAAQAESFPRAARLKGRFDNEEGVGVLMFGCGDKYGSCPERGREALYPETLVFADDEVVDRTRRIGVNRIRVVNYIMGIGKKPWRRGAPIPVLLRQPSNFPHERTRGGGSGPTEYGPSFLSPSKLWSQIALKEAERFEENFRLDVSPNDFSLFDDFFDNSSDNNIGNLLRKPSPNFSYKTFGEIQTDLNVFRNNRESAGAMSRFSADAYSDEIDKLAFNYHTYQVASMHNLYSYTFRQMYDKVLEQPGTAHLCLSNLVSWFSQRRIDSIYGAAGLAANSHTDSYNAISKASSLGLMVNPNEDLYRREAPDFACGPSLFYHDNRVLSEVAMIVLRDDVDGFDSPNVSRASKQVKFESYLQAYRIQNAHRLEAEMFRPPSSATDSAGNILTEVADEDFLGSVNPKLKKYAYDTMRLDDGRNLRVQGFETDPDSWHGPEYPSTLVAKQASERIGGQMHALNDYARRFFGIGDRNPSYRNTSLALFDMTKDGTGVWHQSFHAFFPRYSYQGGDNEGKVSIIKDFYSSMNLAVGPEELIDNVFHAPRQNKISVDKSNTNEAVFRPLSSTEYSRPNYMNDTLKDIELEILTDSFPAYSEVLRREQDENLDSFVESVSDEYNLALQYAAPFFSTLRRAIASGGFGDLDIIEDLNVRHGVRLNLAMPYTLPETENKSETIFYGEDGRGTTFSDFSETALQSGLYTSAAGGVARVSDISEGNIINLSATPSSEDESPDGFGIGSLPGGIFQEPEIDTGQLLADRDIQYQNFTPEYKTTTQQSTTILLNENSQAANEERIGACVVADKGNPLLLSGFNASLLPRVTTLPVAFYERPMQAKECELDVIIFDTKKVVESRDEEMITSLLQDEDFKTFYEFCIPYRRISSLLTIHGTSMLAGYSGMPSIMRSTKSALASTFDLMAQGPARRAAEVGQSLGSRIDNSDLVTAMGTDWPSGGESEDCFEFPDGSEWAEMIKEMIKQFIKYFPSIILRGLAEDLEPSYREMKSHYYACEIPTLNYKSITGRSGDKSTPFGLKGREKGEKKYAPLNLSFPVDFGVGISRFLSLNSDGGRYLGISIDKMIGYVLGGPQQLVDATYAFKVPCMKDREGDFRNWSKYEIGAYGRYGHPMGILTALALTTYELPRDLDYKENSCLIQKAKEEEKPIINCDDEE